MIFNSTHVELEGVSQIMQIRLANARASDRVALPSSLSKSELLLPKGRIRRSFIES
jgi:hypothetical protein